jgi:hypothetical protein
MEGLEKLIQNALLNDVYLTDEEYNEKILKADQATEGHGMTNKAPISEAKRHKRIEMNYYGISINYMANILGELVNTNRILMELLKSTLKERENTDGNAGV